MTRTGVRLLNGGEVEERTEQIYPDTAAAVAAQILRMAEGLEDPRVEFEHDPCPYGGLGANYVSVCGRVVRLTEVN